jgi:hypothetical protein
MQYQLFGRASLRAGTIPAGWDSQAPEKLAVSRVAGTRGGGAPQGRLALGRAPGAPQFSKIGGGGRAPDQQKEKTEKKLIFINIHRLKASPRTGKLGKTQG